LYLISPAPQILEVIILEKCGTGPELLKRSPPGTDEVVYSNVTKTERGRRCGLGHGEDRPAEKCPESSRGTSGIKRNSPDQKDLDLPCSA
jgi:hypothetical protein